MATENNCEAPETRSGPKIVKCLRRDFLPEAVNIAMAGGLW